MNSGLLDPLRHNAWATQELLGFCRGLSADQLQASSDGTYGSILATLQHLISAEGRYRSRLSGAKPNWPRGPEETQDLEELVAMAEDMAKYWDELGATDFEPDRVVHWISPVSGLYTEVQAGVLVAQTLNHGNEHRSQIATILTTIGVEPPHLDGWSYAVATGRFRERATPS
jgi:uncharacterized damage-inducible protein DinB